MRVEEVCLVLWEGVYHLRVGEVCGKQHFQGDLRIRLILKMLLQRLGEVYLIDLESSSFRMLGNRDTVVTVSASLRS